MSYQKRVRRLTIPLESSQNIKDATEILLVLINALGKISRSPNSERNKVSIAQFETMVANTELKSRANDKPFSSYYKGAT
mgnify:FL=1|jgi:hypothetical protein|tara:strand:+ start:236 stop:475 length:240 start_codon:yes stop_codon:yes gene_type:complete